MDKYFKHNLDTLKTILSPLENEWKDWEKEGKLNWYDTHLAQNTAVYLRFLMARAVAVQFAEFGENGERTLEATFGGDYQSDNTYNHNEPWTRDMVVVKRQAHEGGENQAYTIGFAPHYGGDVRGNYGDYVILTFKDIYDFAEAHDEFIREQTATLDIDDKEYRLYWSGAGESFVLETDDWTFSRDDICISGTEEADIIKEIKEKYL